jgi:hypothetical protein
MINMTKGKNGLFNLFWQEQRSIAFVAVSGGLIFWFGYSFWQGLLFAIILALIPQPPVLINILISRRKGRLSGTHRLGLRGDELKTDPSHFVEINAPLVPNEWGYPPVDAERLWTISEGPGLYRIKSIPFYAPGLSYGDLVATHRTDDQTVILEVASCSGHSKLLIVVHRHRLIKRIREQLTALGCYTEHNFIKGFLSVDVPVDVEYHPVYALLSGYRDAKEILFEEPVLRHVMDLEHRG